MRNLAGAFVVALLLFTFDVQAAETAPATAAPAAATETLYLRAQASIPLLATPSATAVAVRQMTPGDAVTVLGRQAGFVNVQAADGVQGWLRETDLTAVAPPTARVAELEREADRLRGELASTQDSLDAAEGRLRQARQAAASARESGADQSATLQAENTGLREQLATAADEISRLETRLTEIETAQRVARESAELLASRQPPEESLVSSRFSNLELIAGAAAALGLVLFGVWFGTASARRRLRRRYHGLEL